MLSPVRIHQDANMINLVRVLSSFPGLEVLYSCGGHEKVTEEGQNAAGQWHVDMSISQNRAGWHLIEFFGHHINVECWAGGIHVLFLPVSPLLTGKPGQWLMFSLTPFGPGEIDPEIIASRLKAVRGKYR